MVFNLNKCGTWDLKSSLSVYNEWKCEKSRKTFFFHEKSFSSPELFLSLLIYCLPECKEKYESFVCASSNGSFFTAKVSIFFCCLFHLSKIAFKAFSSGIREKFWKEKKVCNFGRNWVMSKSTLFPKLNLVTLLTVMWLYWNSFPKSFCKRPPQKGEAFVTLDKHVIPFEPFFPHRSDNSEAFSI